MKSNPMTTCDYYKLGHMTMDVPGVKRVVSTWTPRHHKHDAAFNEKTVTFGHQYVVKRYFVEFFEGFFAGDFQEYKDDFIEIAQNTFNPKYIDPICRAFEKLHELGYLPIEVWALPEGTLVPDGCPQAMLFNTHRDFGWLPQFLEDLWSNSSWGPATSATTAYYRRKLAEPFYEKSDNPEAIRSLCGDFSLRGMTSHEAGAISSLGHLLSFDKTATIDANRIAKQYYNADLVTKPVGYGLPSLEHSVVVKGVAYFKDKIINGDFFTGELFTEAEKYRRPLRIALNENWEINLMAEMCFMIYLLTEVQPEGNFSYVSDTYDYWGVIGKILPVIKDIIKARNGKLIIRPDSGDPAKIILGSGLRLRDSDFDRVVGYFRFGPELESLGTLNALGKIFGVTTNTHGLKVLDPCIGLIYGDAITADIEKQILEGERDLGWAPESVMLGIGAYTYQFVTRDTRGFAIKAVNCTIAGLGEIAIFKAPKTDSGKKSQRGAVVVYRASDRIEDKFKVGGFWDGYSLEVALNNSFQMMRPIFCNGELMNTETIYEIRDRLWNGKF